MISLVAAAAAASRAPGSRAGVVTSTPARAEVSCAETSDLVASGLRPVTVPPAAIAPSAIPAHGAMFGAQMASTSPGAKPRTARPAATWPIRFASVL